MLFVGGPAKAHFEERFEEPVLQKRLQSSNGTKHEDAGSKTRAEKQMDVMTETEVEAAVFILR